MPAGEYDESHSTMAEETPSTPQQREPPQEEGSFAQEEEGSSAQSVSHGKQHDTEDTPAQTPNTAQQQPQQAQPQQAQATPATATAPAVNGGPQQQQQQRYASSSGPRSRRARAEAGRRAQFPPDTTMPTHRPSDPEEELVKKRVFVGNLPRECTPRQLVDFLGNRYGRMIDVNIVMEKETNTSKGYGFVTFLTEEQAEACITQKNETMHGRQLNFGPAKRQAQPRPRQRRDWSQPQTYGTSYDNTGPSRGSNGGSGAAGAAPVAAAAPYYMSPAQAYAMQGDPNQFYQPMYAWPQQMPAGPMGMQPGMDAQAQADAAFYAQAGMMAPMAYPQSPGVPNSPMYSPGQAAVISSNGQPFFAQPMFVYPDANAPGGAVAFPAGMAAGAAAMQGPPPQGDQVLVNGMENMALGAPVDKPQQGPA